MAHWWDLKFLGSSGRKTSVSGFDCTGNACWISWLDLFAKRKVSNATSLTMLLNVKCKIIQDLPRLKLPCSIVISHEWPDRKITAEQPEQHVKCTKNCPKLMLSLFYSVATQHDTCPVCRKSLNGEDRSSQPPSESPSLSMDPRTQERWSFWDTHLCHPFGSPRLHPATHREDEKRFSLFLFSISVAVIIISVWYFFLYFLFSILMPFLLNHVCRNPYRRLNSHSRSLQDLPSSSFFFSA